MNVELIFEWEGQMIKKKKVNNNQVLMTTSPMEEIRKDHILYSSGMGKGRRDFKYSGWEEGESLSEESVFSCDAKEPASQRSGWKTFQAGVPAGAKALGQRRVPSRPL